MNSVQVCVFIGLIQGFKDKEGVVLPHTPVWTVSAVCCGSPVEQLGQRKVKTGKCECKETLLGSLTLEAYLNALVNTWISSECPFNLWLLLRPGAGICPVLNVI